MITTENKENIAYSTVDENEKNIVYPEPREANQSIVYLEAERTKNISYLKLRETNQSAVYLEAERIKKNIVHPDETKQNILILPEIKSRKVYIAEEPEEIVREVSRNIVSYSRDYQEVDTDVKVSTLFTVEEMNPLFSFNPDFPLSCLSIVIFIPRVYYA